MSDNERIFGDLELAFTDQFEPRWNDKGSDADDDVAFFHPKPRRGFHALGSLGLAVNGYRAQGRTASTPA